MRTKQKWAASIMPQQCGVCYRQSPRPRHLTLHHSLPTGHQEETNMALATRHASLRAAPLSAVSAFQQCQRTHQTRFRFPPLQPTFRLPPSAFSLSEPSAPSVAKTVNVECRMFPLSYLCASVSLWQKYFVHPPLRIYPCLPSIIDSVVK